MRSDSVKNVSAYADQNHAPSLAAVRLKYVIQEGMKTDKTFFEIR